MVLVAVALGSRSGRRRQCVPAPADLADELDDGGGLELTDGADNTTAFFTPDLLSLLANPID